MDAILIQIRTAYIHIDLRGGEPQLGQYYIAEYANRKGFNVKVKSYSSNDPIVQSISCLLETHNSRIIGFYVDSENLWVIRRISAALKQSRPDIFIVIGGPQVTGDAELAMRRIPFADCGIIGEGEEPFTELLDCILRDQTDISKIQGLAYKGSDGSINYTGLRKQTENLDKYPWPRRYEYALDEDIVFDQLSTGRGCIGKCAFCFEGNKKANILRLRSVENVLEEIDYLISHLPTHKYLSFLDDTFILNKKRTEQICDHLIKKYKGSIGWFCEGRVDILSRNLELLPMLKDAGCIRIQLGGESGNQDVLNL